MTEEIEEDFQKYNLCRFCKKSTEFDGVRAHCHLTGKYRGPAHGICNINVTQEQSNFKPFLFNNFSNYVCHLFLKS